MVLKQNLWGRLQLISICQDHYLTSTFGKFKLLKWAYLIKAQICIWMNWQELREGGVKAGEFRLTNCEELKHVWYYQLMPVYIFIPRNFWEWSFKITLDDDR
jgi:hypothetical protein